MSKFDFNVKLNKKPLMALLNKLAENPNMDDKKFYGLQKKYTSSQKKIFAKTQLLKGLDELKAELNLTDKQLKKVRTRLKMKKTRTISGVTPVTVLTKPFPCPGKCVFCPNDVRMPKSYLTDEPGAQRALRNRFDPYMQTFNRLTAFKNMGHATDKVELLILGGTWSSYPKEYQRWFVKRCFDAFNDFELRYTGKMIQPTISQPFDESSLTSVDGQDVFNNKNTYNKAISKALKPRIEQAKSETATWLELQDVQELNVLSKTKCIGLVIETRPDEISVDEVINIRKLGATKVQIGIQSLNDEVLLMNKRGHNVKQTEAAINLLRSAGFKIHAHWMPNLLGSSVEKDKKDAEDLWDNINIRPDELKIYPCSLIESAELMNYYKSGEWHAYNDEELAEIIIHALKSVPEYCRVTRVIRDIPSTDIVVGNKKTNFRQIVDKQLQNKNIKLKEIRSREVRDKFVEYKDFRLESVKYNTTISNEIFLQFINSKKQIAGFLRLSIPKSTTNKVFSELNGCAIIREVHVYGTSLQVKNNANSNSNLSAQHMGFGKKLIEEAESLAKKAGFNKLAVISAIGTREYYSKLGYNLLDLYQIKNL